MNALVMALGYLTLGLFALVILASPLLVLVAGILLPLLLPISLPIFLVWASWFAVRDYFRGRPPHMW